MMENRIYCIDTSFLINGWRKHYPRVVFPAIWDRLDLMMVMEEKPVFACVEVFEDLKKQNDDLLTWAKQRKTVLFRDATKQVLKELDRIMASFPNFAAMGGSTNASDPWVIAHAKAAGAIVVTDEIPAKAPKPTKPPKIPDVCDALGVHWLKPIDFFQAVGIKLELVRDE